MLHRSGIRLRPFFMVRFPVLAVVALLATFLAPFGGIAHADSGDAGSYRFGVASAFCENQTGGPLFGCTPWDGVVVWFAVEHPDQTFTTSCATVSPGTADARAAGCAIDVPYGATVTVSIDPAQVPAGYVLNQDAVQVWTAPDGPPDGEVGIPVFTLDLASTEGEEPTVGSDAHAARVVSGSCDSGLGETIATLSPVAMAQGEPVGQASATEMETSFTTIAVGLDGIIDGPSAVVAYATTAGDSAAIACGDIGGVNDGDGELVVLLSPVDGSGAVGMARVAYNPADASMTDITIYLAE